MTPRFDWKCHDCGLIFERKIAKDEKPPVCPYCESINVSKQPPLITVHFKGSGWTTKGNAPNES